MEQTDEARAARERINQSVNDGIGAATGDGYWAMWSARLVIAELRVLADELRANR